jgi:hypothetical protein
VLSAFRAGRKAENCAKISNIISVFGYVTVKGIANPAQAWTEPDGSTKLRPPDFKTIGT